MKFLEKYGITEEQIQTIRETLKNSNINEELFIYNPEKICEILDIFKEIGVTNLFDVIVTSPYMFLDTVKSIKYRIDCYGDDKKLGELINEDPYNLDLANLL